MIPRDLPRAQQLPGLVHVIALRGKEMATLIGLHPAARGCFAILVVSALRSPRPDD